jgi:hypothetical protein
VSRSSSCGSLAFLPCREASNNSCRASICEYLGFLNFTRLIVHHAYTDAAGLARWHRHDRASLTGDPISRRTAHGSDQRYDRFSLPNVSHPCGEFWKASHTTAASVEVENDGLDCWVLIGILKGTVGSEQRRPEQEIE